MIIDFDGTIAEQGPDGTVGDALPGAIEALQLLSTCHTLILWTCRGNEWLDNAVAWLVEHDAYVFDKINRNVHALPDGYLPRKVFAHVYIDDRAFGGFPGWDVIVKELV